MAHGYVDNMQIIVDGEVIAEVTSVDVDLEEALPEPVETVTVTGVIDIIDIDWNETWLVAYQARMYANYFKN